MLETNWTSEFASAFKDLDSLYQFLGWEIPSGLAEVSKTYPIFIPRRLAQKIKLQGQDSGLAREFLPSALEADEDLNRKGSLDPIGDKAHLVAPQLIHRYPSRALFTPTSVCPVHCRYCFRKNELDSNDKLFEAQFEDTLRYLKDHSEISEIIFTGGDPLTLSNEKISRYLQAFKQISSIKDIRFHTRYPVILPSRIDDGFLGLLLSASENFRTVSLAIHCNVKEEIDEAAKIAISKLSKLPVQLLSQTVLLKGVNDQKDTLLALFETFLELKVRPYYLHHPDAVKGGMHFSLSLQEGRKLYQTLRKSLPGWALPHYVIDLPGGHGKIQAFNPETHGFSGQFLTMEGRLVDHQENHFNY